MITWIGAAPREPRCWRRSSSPSLSSLSSPSWSWSSPLHRHYITLIIKAQPEQLLGFSVLKTMYWLVLKPPFVLQLMVVRPKMIRIINDNNGDDDDDDNDHDDDNLILFNKCNISGRPAIKEHRLIWNPRSALWFTTMKTMMIDADGDRLMLMVTMMIDADGDRLLPSMLIHVQFYRCPVFTTFLKYWISR